MKILLNGKEHELAQGQSVAALLQTLKVPPAGTAVVVDGAVVPAADHARRALAEGNRVDIVRAIGGG
jgi:sulfur carrier protein